MIDQLDTEPPRSRLPLIVGAVVAVVAIIVATVLATNMLGGDDKPGPPTSGVETSSAGGTETTSPTTPVKGGSAAGAAGCLGGVNPTSSVLEAQKQAALDGKGAAGFAATVMRWRVQYPVDPDYATKARQLMSPDAGSDLLTRKPPQAGDEDSVWGTTDDARYRVSEVSDTSATVEISMPAFGVTEEYPDGVEVSYAARWRLVADGGRWRVADMDPLDESDSARTELEAEGLTFKGAC